MPSYRQRSARSYASSWSSCGERVPRGILEQSVRGEPLGGTAVELRLFVGGKPGCTGAKDTGRQRVHAQPLAAFPGDQDRRLARETGESLRCVGEAGQRAAQVRMHVVEQSDAGEEGGVVRIEVGQQHADEVVVQVAGPGRDGVHGAARIAAARNRGHRELQAERPAFGQLVQPCSRVGVDAGAEARAHQRDRLVDPEAQLLGADRRALAIAHQVRDAEFDVAAGRHHDAQVRRRVVQEVGERFARRRRQPLRGIDDEHHVERGLRDLGEPRRDAVESHRARRLRAACGRTWAGRIRRGRRAPVPAAGAAGRPRPAPSARRRPRRARGARGATVRAAMSCRIPRAPAPGSRAGP